MICVSNHTLGIQGLLRLTTNSSGCQIHAPGPGPGLGLGPGLGKGLGPDQCREVVEG